ncbi:MAG: hypothetical protein ACPGVA_02970 [Pikeienuella sp.]
MHLNLVKDVDTVDETPPAASRARDLVALASIVDFAIYTAESSNSKEALAYLQQVRDIVRVDLAEANRS